MKKLGLLTGVVVVGILGACESSETSGESNYHLETLMGLFSGVKVEQRIMLHVVSLFKPRMLWMHRL